MPTDQWKDEFTLVHRDREMSLPLSDEDREYLINRGLDTMANRADARHVQNQLNGAVQNDSGEVVDPEDDYNRWKAAELKAECEARDLDSSGTKVDMITRLEANDAEEEPPAE